jgi:hypothetical protein
LRLLYLRLAYDSLFREGLPLRGIPCRDRRDALFVAAARVTLGETYLRLDRTLRVSHALENTVSATTELTTFTFAPLFACHGLIIP